MKTYEVVAAIVVRDGKILAAQRGYGELQGGWEFPGGKIERGESREEALAREMKEELDAEISIDAFFQTVEYTYDDFHMTMHCYLCSIPDGHMALLEHSDARWLGKDEVDAVDWLPADVAVVDALKERLS